LHGAFEYALAKNAIIYRNEQPEEFYLAQVADFICTLELTALKYQAGEQTSTADRFFGAWGNLTKNYLRALRKKLLR